MFFVCFSIAGAVMIVFVGGGGLCQSCSIAMSSVRSTFGLPCLRLAWIVMILLLFPCSFKGTYTLAVSMQRFKLTQSWQMSLVEMVS